MNQVTIGGIAALACATAAGCGGGGGPDPEAIRDGVKSTIERGPVRVSFRGRLQVGGAGRELTFTGSGHDHPARRSFDLSTSSGDFAEATGGASRSDFDQKIIKLGPRIYIWSPLTAARHAWLTLDVGDFSESDGEAAQVLAQSHQSTSAQIFDYARAAETEKEVGDERVAGVETTHYAGTVPLDEVADHVPAEERAAVADNAATLSEATGESSVPIDVWLDRDRLVRRARLRYTLIRGPVTGEPFEADFTLEADFAEHGRAVRIRAPRGKTLTVDEFQAVAE